MKKRQIDDFFERLDKALNVEAEIILTGASAGSLMGHLRPSVDIDFEIRPRSGTAAAGKERIHQAVLDTAKEAKVAVNFSDDIGHWSMICFLDYRRTAAPYKKIGRLSVKLIAPEHWTIGKMGRFLELDVQDMMKVIRLKKIPWRDLAALWARALKASVLSSELGHFRRHVEFFLKKCGPRLWGKEFSADEAIAFFRKRAGVC